MKKVFETPKNENYFLGYYDKSPLDINSEKLLACKSSFIDRMPQKDDELIIGYFDWRNSEQFIPLTQTKAWNWQQGCMLQWLGSEFNNKIIFNDRIENKFVTVIYDIVTKEKELLPMAYYTASSMGDFVLCIDNERHTFYRSGYSYKGIEKLEKKVPFLEDDGIWFCDIKSKKLKQVISLKQMANIKPLSNMKGAIHYLEHLMISPNNKRFIFMHRWNTTDGGVYARLYSANVDGSDIYLLNDSGRMSHYSWRNNSEIIAWGGLPNPINTLRKYKNVVKFFIKPLMPIYKKISGGNSVDGNTKISAMVSGDSYILFTDKSKTTQRISPNKLTKDGHPSFSKCNEDLMITDIYPDMNNEYKEDLILYSMQNQKVLKKMNLNHTPSLARGASRCDLHPKWSHDGQFIAIDTLDQGFRSIYLYQLDENYE